MWQIQNVQNIETDEWWWAGAWEQDREPAGLKADGKGSSSGDGHTVLWTH